MSNQCEFEFLEFDEQLKLIFSGQFIGSIPYESRTLSLYLVNKEYYVEVFSEENGKEIDFTCLAADDRLASYVDLNLLMN